MTDCSISTSRCLTFLFFVCFVERKPTDIQCFKNFVFLGEDSLIIDMKTDSTRTARGLFLMSNTCETETLAKHHAGDISQ